MKSGADILEKLVERHTKQVALAQQNLFDWSKRITTWLIIGNAAALVYCLNVYVSDSGLLDKVQIQKSAISFASGLLIAFIGASTGYLSSMYVFVNLAKSTEYLDTILINMKYIDELESEGIDVEDDSSFHQKIREAEQGIQSFNVTKKRAYYLSAFILILYAISALCFAYGSLNPILFS